MLLGYCIWACISFIILNIGYIFHMGIDPSDGDSLGDMLLVTIPLASIWFLSMPILICMLISIGIMKMIVLIDKRVKNKISERSNCNVSTNEKR